MNMNVLNVKLTFTEEILGTLPGNPEIFTDYIASKAPVVETKDGEIATDPDTEEEIKAISIDEAVDEALQKSITIFPKDENGNPFIYDYQVKGFFKDACGMLKRVPGTKSSKIKAYKKEIDGLIFLEDRKNMLSVNGEIGICQRPLRVSNATGERTTLAVSETIPAGTTIELGIKYMVDSQKELIKEWLNYGSLHGIGQWRNSGKGTFAWEEI